jgi:ferric-dicitrate binding protein FerR (iron transport regulator)
MDCAKAKDLMTRAVSGNASTADDAALRAHAASCAACAEAFSRARAVWALLGRLPATRASRDVDPLKLVRRRPIPWWAAGVAAAVLLAAAGLLSLRPSPAVPANVAEKPAQVEPPPVAPSPEQIRAERELETVVQEKEEAHAPPAPDVKPAPAAPEQPEKGEKKGPLVAKPVPEPQKTPAKTEGETAKAEAPPAPVKPAVPPAPAAPSRDTLPTAATVDRAEGQVVATINGETVPVNALFRLTDADAVATLGKNSQAVLAYEDGTRIVLGGDTAIGRVLLRANEGKRIDVLQGVVAAQVARRAGEDALTFRTPNADARVLGTRLILLVGPASTRLDVKEGRVKLVRREDGASVDVTADHYAIAAKGTSLASRTIPGPKVALREDFDRGRWSPLWTPQIEPGQGVKTVVQNDALVFSVERTAGPDVAPSALPNDQGPLKKTLDQVQRLSALASKKDWPRAAALETKGNFTFSNETPLRVRVNAWHSGSDADRIFWLGLNRGTPGQGVSLERRGDLLELRVDGAVAPLWKKELPCAREWESLELWITKDQVALRREGLTLAVEPNPLKTKVARLSTGTCAKAELKQEAETRLDDLEAAWLTKEDFDHISR